MFHSTLARVVAAGSLAIAAMPLGCGPNSPTLGPTTSAAVNVMSVIPEAGPTGGDQVIQVTGFGFQAGAALTFGGVAAQVVEVMPATIIARTPAHTAGTVDVAVMNPDGQTGRLQRGYMFGVFAVTATPTVAAPGDQLTVSFAAPAGRSCNGGGDWIAIYKVGDPDKTGASNGHSDLWYDHLCGATSGTRTVAAPALAGNYEFRYLVGDTSVARSDTVRVQER